VILAGLRPSLILLALLPTSGYATAFWTGSAAGFTVVWESSDLEAVSQADGRVVFSAKAQFERRGSMIGRADPA